MQAPSAQKRPTSEFGFIKSWLKPLFGSPFNALCSIAFIWILIQILPPLISWGYTNAVFAADPQACQDARGVGACWGLIKAKSSVILWGRYPFAQQWRVQLSTVLLLLLIFRSSILATTTGLRKTMFLEWGAVLIFIFVLMSGYLGPFEFLRSSALNSTLSAPFITKVPLSVINGRSPIKTS